VPASSQTGPRWKRSAAGMNVPQVTVRAVALEVTSPTHSLPPLPHDCGVTGSEGLRMGHLGLMAVVAECLFVADRAVLSIRLSLQWMHADEVGVVRKRDAVAAYAIVTGMARCTRGKRSHTMRLLPVRPVRNGPLSTAETLIRGALLVAYAAVRPDLGGRVTAQTLIHLHRLWPFDCAAMGGFRMAFSAHTAL